MNKRIIGFFLGFVLFSGVLAYYLLSQEEDNDVKLSDFTSSYTCPEEGAPKLCETPLEISVECVMPGDRYYNSNPTLTESEFVTLQKVCDFLPVWLNTDPRLNILDKKQENHFYFGFGIIDDSFSGLSLISEKRRATYPITRANPKFDFANPIGLYIKLAIEKLTEEGYVH